jgi:hypothetical protein
MELRRSLFANFTLQTTTGSAAHYWVGRVVGEFSGCLVGGKPEYLGGPTRQ